MEISFTIDDVKLTVVLAHGRLNYYRDDGEDWSEEDYHAALRAAMEKLVETQHNLVYLKWRTHQIKLENLKVRCELEEIQTELANIAKQFREVTKTLDLNHREH